MLEVRNNFALLLLIPFVLYSCFDHSSETENKREESQDQKKINATFIYSSSSDDEFLVKLDDNKMITFERFTSVIMQKLNHVPYYHKHIGEWKKINCSIYSSDFYSFLVFEQNEIGVIYLKKCHPETRSKYYLSEHDNYNKEYLKKLVKDCEFIEETYIDTSKYCSFVDPPPTFEVN